jgi:putative MFS transporter
MEVMLISFALPAMGAEWSLGAAQKGALATAIFVGMFVGALFWGRLADRLGRKGAFIATIAIDSIFGLASAFAPSFPVFLGLRALTGFGVGGTLPVDYGMFTEYVPAKDRGKRLVLLESFWAFGTLVAAALAWLIVPRLGWRALFAVSAVPGLLLFLVRSSVPESPRFLIASGRGEEARAILAKVAKINGSSLPEGPLSAPADGASGRAVDLFSPALRRTTALLWLVWFTISIGYYGAFTWLPSWLRSKGVPLPAVYPYATLMALAQLPGYFSAAYLVERWGRRATLGFYLAGSGLAALAFAFAASPFQVAAAAAVLSFFALGAWGALYAYTPEAYPTVVRTTGIGAASGMTRLAGMVAPSIGAFAAGGGSLVGPLAVFACAYFTGSVGSFLLPHETRDEELDDAL